jgi:predicted nucleotidyltransferase
MIKEQDLMIKLLTVLFPKAKIYLYGSRARGDYKVGSDVDIAIDDKRELSIFELARAKNVLEGLNTIYTFDVIDLNSIPEKMKNIILKEGIVWKS